MRGDLGPLRVTRASSIDHALQVMAAERPKPIAGGTDLFVALNDGKSPSGHYLDLSPLAKQLKAVTVEEGALGIRALATYTDLRRSKEVAKRAPVLAEMARTVGAIAIQNRGTIAGSIANASPASDPAPVLMALDAWVWLRSTAGGRAVAISEFFTGYRQTAAKPDELIIGIRIPPDSNAGWKHFYRKVGTRQAQAISKVVIAGAIKLGKGKKVEGVRLAFGSVAATTVRARAAEAALLGEVLSPKTVVAAQQALSRDITPIDDIRSTSAYRMHVARTLMATMLLR
jgi:CO/xanthine dehydrogenase FAD-binding subunit